MGNIIYRIKEIGALCFGVLCLYSLAFAVGKGISHLLNYL